MMKKDEPVIIMEKSKMFNKVSFCKVFEASYPRQTGETLHCHDYTQIWYVKKGCCENWLDGKKYAAAQGSVFVIPPFVPHITKLPEGGSIICCDIDLPKILAAAPELSEASTSDPSSSILNMVMFNMLIDKTQNLQSSFTLSRRTEYLVGMQMDSLLQEYTQEQAYYQDFLWVNIQNLLLLLAREFRQSPAHDASVMMYNQNKAALEKTIGYIQTHYAESLTLETVCRYSGLSKTYFCGLFKLMTKKTFVEYLLDIRTQHAMALLENTEYSITEISNMTGFNDSTYFSRTFRRLVGMSPRSYRAIRAE